MFNDDKDLIVDETLGLNTPKNDQETKNEEINKIVNEMKNQELIGVDDIPLDPKSNEFVSIIKDNVNFCVEELKEINDTMEKISTQKNSELFFRKSENIKLLSRYMAKMADVNQKTLDLLILLLGASGRVSDDYETILATIDELGQLNGGEAEVLNYLVKIKKMVYEIHDNELKLKHVMEESATTKDIVTNADIEFKKEIEESQKARKLIDSKCNRLQRRISQNNFFISICLIFIIALAIFVGIKFYVF